MGRNLAKNSLLNIVKTLVTYVFPLVTFMYASRIFQSEGVGKINFAQSYTAYFILFAMLGIEKYGIREIAQVRDNRENLSRLAHELMMLNALSILVAYLAFFVSLFSFYRLQAYRVLLLINSFSIALTAMGLNWLYVGMEDYKYITIRSCAVNAVALVLLFLLVHEPEDIYIFVIIQTAAATGSNVLNLIHSRKYVIYRNMHGYSPLRHLRPVMVIFCMTLFIEIFTHLDVTMLGLISGDEATGLYAAAHKVSGIVTAVISAAIMVLMPRVSFYAKNNQLEEIKKLSKSAVNYICMLSIPAALGVIALSRQIILILSGGDFLDAVMTADILAGRILLSPVNGFFVLYLFIPLGRERNNLISTGTAALLNFTLNAFVIPHYAQNGVAVATVLAELVELIINLLFLRAIMPVKLLFTHIWQYILASCVIIPVFLVFSCFLSNIYLLTAAVAAVSAGLYLLILCLLRNEYVLPIIKKFCHT